MDTNKLPAMLTVASNLFLSFALWASTISLLACGEANNGNSCDPGTTVCHSSKEKVLICNPQGNAYQVQDCPQGTLCERGACLPEGCPPESTRCNGNTVQYCDIAGLNWKDIRQCSAEQTCSAGVCLDNACNKHETVCAQTGIYSCAADGTSWLYTACTDDQFCWQGRCITCLDDFQCQDKKRCIENQCQLPQLTVQGIQHSKATQGYVYETHLRAIHGKEPYVWSLESGTLPQGVLLDSTGFIHGIPQIQGVHQLTVIVTDQGQETATGEVSIEVLPPGLHIASGPKLPDGTEGSKYGDPSLPGIQLQATGGISPYAWLIHDGALPAGLDLYADGRIAGIPTNAGDYSFQLRVLDAATETSSQTMQLSVDLAQLTIEAENTYDLMVVKLVILDILIPNTFIPYTTQLVASGGVKPYSWQELPIPESLQAVLALPPFNIDASSWKLPEELAPLPSDGNIRGTVEDSSDASNISIPGSDTVITGYFFYAEVRDSQAPSEHKTALFCIPTMSL